MELTPTFKNPTCSRVWIDGQYLCWQVDRKKKKEVLTKDFLRELAIMENSKEALVNLFERYGPLWSGKKIPCETALSEIRGYQLLWLLVEGVKAIGQPRQHQELKDSFFTPLEHWEHVWEKMKYGIGKYIILPAGFIKEPLESIEREINTAIDDIVSGIPPKKRVLKLWIKIASNGRTDFLPVEPSSEFWPVFDPPPTFNNWEERKNWLHKQLLKNAIELLNKEIKLSLIAPNGRVRVTAQPANAFAWAIGRLILEKVNRCTCGAYTNGGKYCSRKCEIAAMSTGSKQALLDYLNKQVKRGRVTPEESDFIKENLGRVFKPGDSEAGLLKKILKILTKKYPDRDFSFLQGFGSRKAERKRRGQNNGR